MAEKKLVPQVGDIIVAEWPGQGLQEFRISLIRPSENGVMCAVFGKDGIVGAEALDDLKFNPEQGVWVVS